MDVFRHLQFATVLSSPMIVFFATLPAITSISLAESRNVSASPENHQILRVSNRPTDYKDGDHVYRNYFGTLDHTIVTLYRDRWSYHEKQVPYAMTWWKHEVLSIGSLDHYGRAPHESDVRKDFAEMVFRMRLDRAVRTYLESNERPPGLRRTGRALETIKNYSVRVDPEKTSRGELKMGYDVFTDGSKIEYIATFLQGGIYHPHLLGALVGSKPKDATTLILTGHPGSGLPSASLSYQLSGQTYSAWLTKPLSPSVDTQLVTVQPLRQRQSIATTYEMRLIYRF